MNYAKKTMTLAAKELHRVADEFITIRDVKIPDGDLQSPDDAEEQLHSIKKTMIELGMLAKNLNMQLHRYCTNDISAAVPVEESSLHIASILALYHKVHTALLQLEDGPMVPGLFKAGQEASESAFRMHEALVKYWLKGGVS